VNGTYNKTSESRLVSGTDDTSNPAPISCFKRNIEFIYSYAVILYNPLTSEVTSPTKISAFVTVPVNEPLEPLLTGIPL